MTQSPRLIVAQGVHEALASIAGIPDWHDFEKRHMDKIALALHSAYKAWQVQSENLPDQTTEAGETVWRLCVGEVAKVLADDNRAFKPDKFVTACVGGCKPLSGRARRTKR